MTSPPSSPSVHPARSRNVTAVLGPTNTGKTHLAIERMLGHGIRHDRPAAAAAGARNLRPGRRPRRRGCRRARHRRGEDQSRPRRATSSAPSRPCRATVEVDFLAIDEVQLAADPERGHVFTDRLLHARGTQETLLLGAGTMREADQGAAARRRISSPRPRLSKLTYAGPKKISRLPRRTAIVAFSADEVYEIAELIRRPARRRRRGAGRALAAHAQRPGRALSVGRRRLSGRHRRHRHGPQLDLDHVAFAATRKFDGSRAPEPDAGRDRPDRRPGRAAHERRLVRRHRRCRAVRCRIDRSRSRSTSSSRCGRCNGATARSTSPRSPP